MLLVILLDSNEVVPVPLCYSAQVEVFAFYFCLSSFRQATHTTQSYISVIFYFFSYKVVFVVTV